MSQFTTNFKGELVWKNTWQNLEKFEYHVGSYPSEEVITVPVKFETDFASVPRIFWAVISPIDTHAKAAVIHDYLYYTGQYSRKEADKIFKEALEVLNVAPWKVWCMYRGVRIGSWYAWHNHRKRQKKEQRR
jgi:hypothetical protein